jgi:hypothetical protein
LTINLIAIKIRRIDVKSTWPILQICAVDFPNPRGGFSQSARRIPQIHEADFSKMQR